MEEAVSLIRDGSLSSDHLDLLRRLKEDSHVYQTQWESFVCSNAFVERVFGVMNRWEGVELLCEGHSVDLLECLLINPNNRPIVFHACRVESRMELMIHMMLVHTSVADQLVSVLWRSFEGKGKHVGVFCRSLLRVAKEREASVGASNFRDLVGLVMRGLQLLGTDESDARTAAQGYESLVTFVRLVRPDDGGSHRYFVLERFSDTFLSCASDERRYSSVLHMTNFLERFVSLDSRALETVWTAKIPQALVARLPRERSKTQNDEDHSRHFDAVDAAEEAASILNLLVGFCDTYERREMVLELLSVQDLGAVFDAASVFDRAVQELGGGGARSLASISGNKVERSRGDGQAGAGAGTGADVVADTPDISPMPPAPPLSRRTSSFGAHATAVSTQCSLLLAVTRLVLAVAPDVGTFAAFLETRVEGPLMLLVQAAYGSQAKARVAPIRTLNDMLRRMYEKVDTSEVHVRLDGFARRIGGVLVNMLKDGSSHGSDSGSGSSGRGGVESSKGDVGLGRLQNEVHVVASLVQIADAHRHMATESNTNNSNTGKQEGMAWCGVESGTEPDEVLPNWLLDALHGGHADESPDWRWEDLPATTVVYRLCRMAYALVLLRAGHDADHALPARSPLVGPLCPPVLLPCLAGFCAGHMFEMALALQDGDTDYLFEEKGSQLSCGDDDVSIMQSIGMWIMSTMLSPKLREQYLDDEPQIMEWCEITCQLGRSDLDSYKRGCGDVLVSRKLELIASALDAGGRALQKNANRPTTLPSAAEQQFREPTLVEAMFLALWRGCAVEKVLRVLMLAAQSFVNLSPNQEEQIAIMVLIGLNSRLTSVRVLASNVIVTVDEHRPEIMHRVFSRPEIEEALLSLVLDEADSSECRISFRGSDDRRSWNSSEDIHGVTENCTAEDVCYLQALCAVARDINESAKRTPALTRWVLNSLPEDCLPGSEAPRRLLLPEAVMLLERHFTSINENQLREPELETTKKRLDSVDIWNDSFLSEREIVMITRRRLREALFTSRSEEQSEQSIAGRNLHARRWESVAAVALCMQIGVRVASAVIASDELCSTSMHRYRYERTCGTMCASVEAIVPMALEWVGKYTFRQTFRRTSSGNLKCDAEDSDESHGAIINSLPHAMTRLAGAALDALLLWPWKRKPCYDRVSDESARGRYATVQKSSTENITTNSITEREFPMCASIVSLLQQCSYSDVHKMGERCIRVLHSMADDDTNLEIMTSMGIEIISNAVHSMTHDRDIMQLYLYVVKRAAEHEHGVYRVSIVECGALTVVWNILSRRWEEEVLIAMNIIYDLLEGDGSGIVQEHIRTVLCGAGRSVSDAGNDTKTRTHSSKHREDPIIKVAQCIDRFKESTEVLLTGGRLAARLIDTGAAFAVASDGGDARANSRENTYVTAVYKRIKHLSKGKLGDKRPEIMEEARRVAEAFPRQKCIIS